MLGIITAVLLAVTLLVNQVAYDFTAWGAQGGGELSNWLYHLTILLGILGFGKLCLLARWRLDLSMIIALTLGFLGACVTAIAYYEIGWQISNTVHNQGAENLIPFFAVTLTALFVWASHWWLSQPRVADLPSSEQAA